MVLAFILFLTLLIGLPLWEGMQGMSVLFPPFQALGMALWHRGWGKTQNPPLGPVKEVVMGALFGSMVCVPAYFVGVWLAGK